MKKNIIALRFPESFKGNHEKKMIITLQEPFIQDLDFQIGDFFSFAFPDPYWDGVIWAVGYDQIHDEISHEDKAFIIWKFAKQIQQDIIDAYKTGIVPRAPYVLDPVFHYDSLSTYYDFESLSIEEPIWLGAVWCDHQFAFYNEYNEVNTRLDYNNLIKGVKSIVLQTFFHIHQGKYVEEPVETVLSTKPKSPIPSDSTKICPFCQVVNESNAGYCKACGAPWGIALETNRKQK